jgi:hypothetical protein
MQVVELQDAMVVAAVRLGDDHTARCGDLELAGLLGFRNPPFIRKLINRNRVEIERHGQLLSDKSRKFWLTQDQAMTVCQLSRAPNAFKVRDMLTQAFSQRGQPETALVPAPSTELMQIVSVTAGVIAKGVAEPLVEEMRRSNKELIGQMQKTDALVSNMAQVVSNVQNDVMEMKQRELRKRRNVSQQTENDHITIIATHYNCMCPCCRNEQVVMAGSKLSTAHLDHWYSANRNTIRDTWIICGSCNLTLNARRDYKLNRDAEFRSYQHLVEKFLMPVEEQQPTLFAKVEER